MDKNIILLLFILALWMLVIRKGKYKTGGTTTHESSSGRDHGGSDGSFGGSGGTTTHESDSGREHGGSSGGFSDATVAAGRSYTL